MTKEETRCVDSCNERSVKPATIMMFNSLIPQMFMGGYDYDSMFYSLQTHHRWCGSCYAFPSRFLLPTYPHVVTFPPPGKSIVYSTDK